MYNVTIWLMTLRDVAIYCQRNSIHRQISLNPDPTKLVRQLFNLYFMEVQCCKIK